MTYHSSKSSICVSFSRHSSAFWINFMLDTFGLPWPTICPALNIQCTKLLLTQFVRTIYMLVKCNFLFNTSLFNHIQYSWYISYKGNLVRRDLFCFSVSQCLSHTPFFLFYFMAFHLTIRTD